MTLQNYDSFINNKRTAMPPSGFSVDRDTLHESLFDFQKDIVFSPFAGIGSEGYQAIKMGRRFVGIELKESYYKTAVNNLRMAVDEVFEEMLG